MSFSATEGAKVDRWTGAQSSSVSPPSELSDPSLRNE